MHASDAKKRKPNEFTCSHCGEHHQRVEGRPLWCPLHECETWDADADRSSDEMDSITPPLDAWRSSVEAEESAPLDLR